MQEQTTTQPPPQQARRADRAETLVLAFGAIAAVLVMAFADTDAAMAYRATFAQLVGR